MNEEFQTCQKSLLAQFLCDGDIKHGRVAFTVDKERYRLKYITVSKKEGRITHI